MPPPPRSIEYRMQVRPMGLTVSLLDPEARMPLSASTLVQFQQHRPGIRVDGAVPAQNRKQDALPEIEVRAELGDISRA